MNMQTLYDKIIRRVLWVEFELKRQQQQQMTTQ
jgi:hypothetical protein